MPFLENSKDGLIMLQNPTQMVPPKKPFTYLSFLRACPPLPPSIGATLSHLQGPDSERAVLTAGRRALFWHAVGFL